MPAVKSRREQYSEATRAALLDTATRLFAERGYTRTSLEDIAVETRVTRGAVYHHFTGKPALFEAVLDQLESTAHARVSQASRARTDPWEAALAALDAFLDQCLDPVYGRLVWQEGPTALGWQRWRECEQKYGFGLIRDLLGTLAKTGAIIAVPLDITALHLFALTGAAGQAIYDAPEPDRPQIREDCATVIRHLITGLRPH